VLCAHLPFPILIVALSVNIFSKTKSNKSLRIHNIFSRIFKILQKEITCKNKFLKFWSLSNLHWGHVRSHTKFGPDRRYNLIGWIDQNKEMKSFLQTQMFWTLYLRFTTLGCKDEKIRVCGKNAFTSNAYHIEAIDFKTLSYTRFPPPHVISLIFILQ